MVRSMKHPAVIHDERRNVKNSFYNSSEFGKFFISTADVIERAMHNIFVCCVINPHFCYHAWATSRHEQSFTLMPEALVSNKFPPRLEGPVSDSFAFSITG